MPVYTIEQLKEAVVRDEICGLTIDTSAYESFKFGFEHGMLAQLSQLRDLNVDFIMIDIIRNEVFEHLTEDARTSKADLKKALKLLPNYWGISNTDRERILEIACQDGNEEARTEQRISAFEEMVDATPLQVALYSDTDKILDQYFNKHPPFSNRKKTEFPDAFALSALEEWADGLGKVIAISKDHDWQQYCESSENLIYVEELSHALDALNTGAGDVLKMVCQRFSGEGKIELEEHLIRCLSKQIDNITEHIELDSSYITDSELVELSIEMNQDFDLAEALQNAEIASYYSGIGITLSLTIPTTIQAEYFIQFFIKDGVDKDYVKIGSEQYNATIDDFEVEVLFVVGIDEEGFYIEDVELLPATAIFDLGYLDLWHDQD